LPTENLSTEKVSQNMVLFVGAFLSLGTFINLLPHAVYISTV